MIRPVFPAWKGNGRPLADRRLVVEGTAGKFRTGAPWRDLSERFGNWNTVSRNFGRWAKDGIWTKVLERVQPRAHELGDLDWVASIGSTIVRVHQRGATLRRPTGALSALSNCKKSCPEPSDHAIGRSRGGLTSKIHLVSDGKGRMLAPVLTAGNVNDTTMLSSTLGEIRVPGRGRPRKRPNRLLADKGYPSRADRAWLAGRGIKATIPDKADQAANRRTKGSSGGRPPSFNLEIYKGRNVVERCFNNSKRWRGIAMRIDKTARNYMAAIQLAAALNWLETGFSNAP